MESIQRDVCLYVLLPYLNPNDVVSILKSDNMLSRHLRTNMSFIRKHMGIQCSIGETSSLCLEYVSINEQILPSAIFQTIEGYHLYWKDAIYTGGIPDAMIPLLEFFEVTIQEEFKELQFVASNLFESAQHKRRKKRIHKVETFASWHLASKNDTKVETLEVSRIKVIPRELLRQINLLGRSLDDFTCEKTRLNLIIPIYNEIFDFVLR